jgi:hypothetical protein
LLVGTYAAALDRGDPPERAFRHAMVTVGGTATDGADPADHD